MSIASEITRINDAKTSIKNSIINKGITVLDTQKIDEYSTLIDSIEIKKPEQSKSTTPSENVQNIIPDNGYTLSQVTVEAISKTYVGSNVTKKSAQTYIPTTTNQTIASGQYLTGTQTIKGDSNLTADNIKSGTTIFGVTGSYAGSTPNLQPKSVTYTSNGTATITPDSGYDGLSSVDVTVNVSGGYNLKKVTYKGSVNKLLTDITITHNCGSIPKFVIVTSNNLNSGYLMAGFGANESQTPSFPMVINTIKANASVSSTTFTYINTSGTSMRYYSGKIYTYYFFY